MESSFRRVIFRNQFVGRDAKRILSELPPGERLDEDFWNTLPEDYYPEVEVNGKVYKEIGRDKSKWSDVELPPLFLVEAAPYSRRLFDKFGKEKKEGDAPLGLAYDEDGLPVGDWQIEDTRFDSKGRTVLDANGRRRGYLEITGLIKEPERKRKFPTWGKKFGAALKDLAGVVGTFTIADAKLCLETENFGWQLGDDDVRVPPLVALRYAEDHCECESIVLFTGLSEIHLDNHEDHGDLHSMLQDLGYVCYNPPTMESRYWGDHIDNSPKIEQAPPDLNTPGPTWYTWFYRLPPYLMNLAVEGEEDDYLNGPIARRYKKKAQAEALLDKKLLDERKAALDARAANEKTKDWYKQYVAELGPERQLDDDDDDDDTPEKE
ncbi:hypothetical protein CTAYLR_008769 [Chrysophaeum taylorii]|uniref:Uncharacterized protein n=1 Tax=Chrysophaeum taylorii TaxID=2483200 RepID=A0AAD7UDM1_9STRA|nr:hypothetical protein CTAYLR_008769 [Chrysophaeum taylorii]